MRWKITSRLTVVIALSAAIVVGTMVLLFHSAATLALENNTKTQMLVAVDDKAAVIESFFPGENAALQSMGRCGAVQATCREASPKRSEWEGRCRQFAPSRSTLKAFALRIT